jgi:hypothetical protein
MTTAAPVVNSNLPAAARRQVKEANKLLAELNAKPVATAPPAAAPAPDAPAADPKFPTVDLASGHVETSDVPAGTTQVPELEQANQRYKSLQGKFNKGERDRIELEARLAAAQDTNRVLLEAAQARPAAPVAPPKPEDQFLALGVTQQEITDYGPELMSIVARVARNMSAGELQGLKTEVAELKRGMSNVGTVVAQNAQQKVYDALNAAFGEKWPVVNNSEEFLAWCQEADVFSGQQRLIGLQDAFRRADAARVVAIFRAYIEGNTSQGPTSRQPQVARETLVAPAQGRGGAGETPGSTGGKVWSDKEIEDFYQRARKGKIPKDEYEATQAEIYRAAAEGRVRSSGHNLNQH